MYFKCSQVRAQKEMKSMGEEVVLSECTARHKQHVIQYGCNRRVLRAPKEMRDVLLGTGGKVMLALCRQTTWLNCVPQS